MGLSPRRLAFLAIWMTQALVTSRASGISRGREVGENYTVLPPVATTMGDQERAIWEARDSCLRKMASETHPGDGRLYCNHTFDGWSCWNFTLAGTRAYIKCPTFIDSFDGARLAYKECTEDGTWWHPPGKDNPWSNYTNCVDMDSFNVQRASIYIFIVGYSLSIIALSASLFIFFYFRPLQCDRVTLHKNLFLSFILNSKAWILYYLFAAQNTNVIDKNPIWCQILHCLTQYFVGCNFFWMFSEGLYLHTIIVMAFTRGTWLLLCCCLIGWVVPLVPAAIYTTVRVVIGQTNHCWLMTTNLQWIVFGPIVFTIFLNLIFLFNIVRVLITKLRAVNSPDTNQTRKAVRAILILIPLLGLQYILFPIAPEEGTGFYDVYMIVSALVTSLQGFMVACIFCFFNGEVVSVIKRKWGQHRLMTTERSYARTSLYTQTTVSVADNSQKALTHTLSPPKSPRLYDNRCQAPGGKPHKPIAKPAHFRVLRDSNNHQGESEYCLPSTGVTTETDPGSGRGCNSSAV